MIGPPHVTLASFPDLNEQCLAIHRELFRAETRAEVTWLVGARTPLENQPGWVSDARFVPRMGVRGVWHFLMARHLFVTHTFFSRLPRVSWQSRVNLWHGMPVKAIGTFDRRQLAPASGASFTYHIATSAMYRTIMAEAFGVDEGTVLVTGNPRTDLMLDPPQGTHRQIGLPPNERIVLYLPTFRRSNLGPGRIDGDPGGATLTANAELEALGDVLDQQQAVLICKSHPAAPTRPVEGGEHPRIVEIDDQWLAARGTGLYRLMSEADVLITDVSSAYLDFLLLDRPIIFLFPDLGEYRRSRPLILEPFEDWAPGPLLRDPRSLPEALDAALAGEDDFSSARRKIRDEVHTHQDARSARRVLQAVGLVGPSVDREPSEGRGGSRS